MALHTHGNKPIAKAKSKPKTREGKSTIKVKKKK